MYLFILRLLTGDGNPGVTSAHSGFPGQSVGYSALVAGETVCLAYVQHHQLPTRQHVELPIYNNWKIGMSTFNSTG